MEGKKTIPVLTPPARKMKGKDGKRKEKKEKENLWSSHSSYGKSTGEGEGDPITS